MAVLFAVLGMLCWGLAPIFGKLGLMGVNPITALCLRTFIASSMVLGWVLLNRTYNDFGNVPPQFWLLIAVEAILATLVGDLAYFMALKYGNVNQVSLIMSCAPIVTLFSSFMLLGETISIYQAVGAFFISIGLMMVCME